MKLTGILAALLVLAVWVSATASDTFSQVWVYEDHGCSGAVVEVLVTEDGFLLVVGLE